MKRILLATAFLSAFALYVPAAHAALGDQSMDPAANTGSDQSSSDDSSDSKKAEAPPSPTPGEKAEQAPVVAAAPDVASMSPTAALFDAITRNDTAAARDAIARGADLNAENVLGEKPIDASIDLGRDDITFMLLAERPLASAASSNAPSRMALKHRPASGKLLMASASKPANPGRPDPAVGFLGF